MDAITFPPAPINEPNLTYAPGSPEREALLVEIEKLERREKNLTAHIGGRWKAGGGAEIEGRPAARPPARARTFKDSTQADAKAAVKAATDAAPEWRALDSTTGARSSSRPPTCSPARGASGSTPRPCSASPRRRSRPRSTRACELIDFWRFNVHYAKQILTDQPIANSPGIWNRTDHRPLEGFVYAITPFNFTAIAGNLPTAPALMGNTVIWKPSPTQQLAASLTMELLEEAGHAAGRHQHAPRRRPRGLQGRAGHPDLAGIHFTGSTPTFQHLWRTVGENIASYRSYPRIVGETGGKDFIVAHPSADPDVVRTAMIRGAFEFQGQKCSAASRAYVARSVWNKMKDSFLAEVEAIAMGDVTDFSNFMGAVIDDRAFAKHKAAITRAKRQSKLDVVVGGQTDDKVGWFVRPTVVASTDPTDAMFTTEYFGPILVVHVYDDGDFEKVARQIEGIAPYALTGVDHRPGPAGDRLGAARSCASRPATSTSTTSRPVRSSGSSRSAAAAPRAPTTRRAPRSTCCAGPRRARSRRRSSRRPTTATRTWGERWTVAPLQLVAMHLGAPAPLRAGADAAARVRAVRGARSR